MKQRIRHSCRLLMVCFLTLASIVNAQDFDFKNYSIAEGLPSETVFSCVQDANGWMWFATDLGVSRFDGYSFTNYTIKDGLTSMMVFRFDIDEQGRLWTCDASKQLAIFDGEKFVPFIHNDVLKRAHGYTAEVNHFEVISEDEIYMSFRTGLPFRLVKGEIQYYDEHNELDKKKIAKIAVIDVGNGRAIGGGYGNYVKFSGGMEFAPIRVVKVNDQIIDYSKLASRKTGGINVLRLKNGDHIVAFAHTVVKISNGEIVQVTDLDEVAIGVPLQDDKGNLWIGTRNVGFICYRQADLEQPILQCTQRWSVTSAFQDNRGGYWFTTLNNGVNFFPSFDFEMVKGSPEANTIELLSSFGDQLVGGEHEGAVYGLTPTGLDSLIKPRTQKGIASLYFNDSGSLFYSSWGQEAELINEMIYDSLPTHLVDIRPIKDGRLIGIYRGGLSIGHSPNHSKRSFLRLGSKCLSYLIQPEGGALIATNMGLLYFDYNKILLDTLAEPYGSFIVNAIETLPGGGIVVGSRSSGLWHFGAEDTFRIDLEFQQDVPAYSSLKTDQQGRIWAGTNMGVILFDRDADSGDYHHTIFGKSDGLPSNVILDIEKRGNELFVATSAGVVKSSIDNLNKSKVPLELHHLKFVVNGTEMDTISNVSLDYTKDNIRFEYKALDFSNPGNITYAHRLIGVDKGWIKNKATVANYPKLNSGDYTFEVKVLNSDHRWGKTFRYSFGIRPPFWQTWWFLTLALLILSSSIGGLIYRRFAMLKQRQAFEQALNKAEHKALRAQINPHFIFNALNSIQNFVGKSDLDSAQHYMAVFARVIRASLNHSSKEFAPLSDEINLLKDYVELESSRLEHPIRFDVNFSKGLNPYTIEIPPMLIQPFVENAIWHGLQPKKSSGNITLNFNMVNEEVLQCIVEDNGVGRSDPEDQNAISRYENRPSGMTITSERIDLIWQRRGLARKIEIEDLTDENGEPVGTRICFQMPINF